MPMGLGLGLALTHGRTEGGGGFTPSSLGASLLAWWNADRADLITLSGAQITSWKDVVAAYDAVQAVSGSRPLYSATSFNGAPSAFLDGIDDELTLASQPFPSGASPSEIWAVVQQDALAADTSQRGVIGYGDAASTSRRLSRTVSGGVNRGNIAVGTGGASPNINETTVDFSGRRVLRGEFGVTQSFLTVSGTKSAAVAAAPATATSRVRIGAFNASVAGQWWSGLIRDIVVTLPLTTDQAAQMQAWADARRMP